MSCVKTMSAPQLVTFGGVIGGTYILRLSLLCWGELSLAHGALEREG